MKLGAYYWDGWYTRLPHHTPRLLQDFPQRMPIWGWLGDTVANMETQIDIAADAGLCYFAFDWYYPEHGTISGMNDCVDRFLKARNCSRMKQCLLVANHDGGRIYRQNWAHFCELVLPYLTDAHALTVNGQPVIYFFEPKNLKDDLGGAEEASACLEQLREMVRAKGLPGVYVVAACPTLPREEDGSVSEDGEKWDAFCRTLEETGFDAISGYNYHRVHLGKDCKELIYPFEKLSADYEKIWDLFVEHSRIPYIPCVNGGWDCRPWEAHPYFGGRGEPSCYSPDRTPYTQYKHVRYAGQWLREHAQRSAEDLAIVYAWNENGEGGFIEPTVGDNGAILRSVARAIRESNE